MILTWIILQVSTIQEPNRAETILVWFSLGIVLLICGSLLHTKLTVSYTDDLLQERSSIPLPVHSTSHTSMDTPSRKVDVYDPRAATLAVLRTLPDSVPYHQPNGLHEREHTTFLNVSMMDADFQPRHTDLVVFDI